MWQMEWLSDVYHVNIIMDSVLIVSMVITHLI